MISFRSSNGRLSFGFPLAFIEKLGQGGSRDVILGLVVDDAEIFAALNHLRDLIQSHVAGLMGVVEFAVLIALNDLNFFHDSPYLHFLEPLAQKPVIPRPIIQPNTAQRTACHDVSSRLLSQITTRRAKVKSRSTGSLEARVRPN